VTQSIVRIPVSEVLVGDAIAILQGPDEPVLSLRKVEEERYTYFEVETLSPTGPVLRRYNFESPCGIRPRFSELPPPTRFEREIL
jgi:hypothetical protein